MCLEFFPKFPQVLHGCSQPRWCVPIICLLSLQKDSTRLAQCRPWVLNPPPSMKEDSLMKERVVTNLITGNHPFRLCIHGCQKILAGIILVEVSFASGVFIKTSFPLCFSSFSCPTHLQVDPSSSRAHLPPFQQKISFCFTWEIHKPYLPLVGICCYQSSVGLWFAVWLSFSVSIHYE